MKTRRGLIKINSGTPYFLRYFCCSGH